MGGTGEVVVQTRVAGRGADRARIVVADDGPGIAAGRSRDRLFVPYFSTKATGMGLGLPIVHQIVSDHGGTIRVEDNAPHGSRFVDRAARRAARCPPRRCRPEAERDPCRASTS